MSSSSSSSPLPARKEEDNDVHDSQDQFDGNEPSVTSTTATVTTDVSAHADASAQAAVPVQTISKKMTDLVISQPSKEDAETKVKRPHTVHILPEEERMKHIRAHEAKVAKEKQEKRSKFVDLILQQVCTFVRVYPSFRNQLLKYGAQHSVIVFNHGTGTSAGTSASTAVSTISDTNGGSSSIAIGFSKEPLELPKLDEPHRLVCISNAVHPTEKDIVVNMNVWVRETEMFLTPQFLLSSDSDDEEEASDDGHDDGDDAKDVATDAPAHAPARDAADASENVSNVVVSKSDSENEEKKKDRSSNDADDVAQIVALDTMREAPSSSLQRRNERRQKVERPPWFHLVDLFPPPPRPYKVGPETDPETGKVVVQNVEAIWEMRRQTGMILQPHYGSINDIENPDADVLGTRERCGEEGCTNVSFAYTHCVRRKWVCESHAKLWQEQSAALRKVAKDANLMCFVFRRLDEEEQEQL